MNQAQVDQHLAVVAHRQPGEDTPHERVPVAHAAGRIVALAGIGRRGEQQRRLFAGHQLGLGSRIGGIAAQQAMLAHQPEIARPRHGIRRRCRRLVEVALVGFVTERGPIVIERRQQAIDLAVLEAEQAEIIGFAVQGVDLRRQRVLVPGRRQRQLIVADAIGARLICRQVLQANDGNIAQAQTLCRQQAAVAGDHRAVIGDQERRREAVTRDRGRDLRHLIIRMQPRIALVRLQARDRPPLDLLGTEAKRGHEGCALRQKNTARRRRDRWLVGCRLGRKDWIRRKPPGTSAKYLISQNE